MIDTILYLHGYNGENSKKYTLLKDRYGSSHNVPKYIHNYDPRINIPQLDEFIRNYSKADLFVIGSSLGGFYALYFTLKYKLNTLLINPSFEPYKTLKNFFSEEVCNAYKEAREEMLTFDRNGLTINMYQALDDEVLDFTSLHQQLDDVLNTQYFENKSHGFNQLEHHFEDIEEMWRK
jgi:predicted esterase YcpF (UPF0227 family)